MQSLPYFVLISVALNAILFFSTHVYRAQSAQPTPAAKASVKASTHSSLDGFDKLCRQGEAESCFAMSIALSNNTVEMTDPIRARMYMEKACALNLAEGCYSLSKMLADGYGGEADAERSLELLMGNCDNHHASSCHVVGHLILRDFVPDNLSHLEYALTSFKKGCILGDKESCEDAELIEKHQQPQKPSARPTQNPRRG